MDDFTPDAWEPVLADYAYEECLAALKVLVTYQPFVSPSDIVDRIRRMRADRRGVTGGLFGSGCGQSRCDCTHTYPCDRGMTDSKDTPGAIAWCGRCWPDRVPEESETREQWIRRLRLAKAAPGG